jgi:hypothetical protein
VQANERFIFYIKKNPVNFENGAEVAGCVAWAEGRLKTQTGYVQEDPTDQGALKLLTCYQVLFTLFFYCVFFFSLRSFVLRVI